MNTPESTETITVRPMSTVVVATSNNERTKATHAKRRKAEDKMAMIFIAIVTGFLLSNFPRIFLNFHEVWVLEHAMTCSSNGFE